MEESERALDPSRLNAVGDLVLTDVREFRALADPVRLTLFDVVGREGPITSATAATRTGRDLGSVEEHLRALESIGLVESETDGRDTRWSPAAKGIYFEIPDDLEAQRAARELSNVMLAKYAELPFAWLREQEPILELEWARAAGLLNARVEMTPAEASGLQQELERVLEPFTSRPSGEVPAGAKPVRIMCYFLPEAAQDAPAAR